MKSKLILSFLVAVTFLTPVIRAEQSGVGHYNPGQTASFIDALPGKPSFAALNIFTYYNGSADAGDTFRLGGRIASGIEATSYANTFAAFYESNLKLLGGNYAFGIAIPYVWMEVKAQAEFTGPFGKITKGRDLRDTNSGVGDINFYPFMLGWTALGGDLKYDVRLGIYAPTGDYSTSQLANIGLNFWTFEPSVSVSWISSKIGTELSLFTGFDFNTENDADNYQSGTQYHLDATIAQHLPLFGGFAGVGANVFYYQQLTGDSGSGAVLGGFKASEVGIGPVVSYIYKGKKLEVAAEVKWLPQIDVSNTTKGDFVWFKVAVSF